MNKKFDTGSLITAIVLTCLVLYYIHHLFGFPGLALLALGMATVVARLAWVGPNHEEGVGSGSLKKAE